MTFKWEHMNIFVNYYENTSCRDYWPKSYQAEHVSSSCIVPMAWLFPGIYHKIQPISCSYSKFTVLFSSASRRINSLTQNHKILCDCRNRWYKQNLPDSFNQTVFKSIFWAGTFCRNVYAFEEWQWPFE